MPRVEGLTPRETEIIALVSKGACYGTVARALRPQISKRTVETMIYRACLRLQLRGRKELIAWWRANGGSG